MMRLEPVKKKKMQLGILNEKLKLEQIGYQCVNGNNIQKLKI